MSYLVLARKSRPQSFAEVVGQRPVVRTLQNALAQNRVPHALIFSGVRGTGKTTLARIMAKALNCEQGPAAEPCNACRSCREITEGTSIDLQEVDGASNRGIQEIRELKEKIRFMPTNSRFKIIIIDEVHMLTTEAFNALLKTLEEPPGHVYFMFATTELHKVPVTILSRCQRYELKRIGHRELATHFLRLAEMEGVRMEPAAVEMIVRESGGSVRDGLSLLDQIFSYCGQEVRTEEVVEVLGLVSHQLVAEVGDALLRGDLAAIYALLDAMYAHGSDSRRFSNDLLAWFRALVVCKVSREPYQMLEVSEDELQELMRVAAAHSLETLTALFNLLLDGLEKAAFSQQPRLALEMVCIRAVQFRDVVPVADLIARLDQVLDNTPIDTILRQPTASAPRPKPQTSAAPPTAQPAPPLAPTRSEPSSLPASSPVEPPPPQDQATAAKPTIAPPAQPLPAERPVPPEQPQPPPPTESQASPAPAAAPEERPTVQPKPPEPAKKRIRQNWDAFLKYVRERQPWVAASLQMADSVDRQGEELIIRFADSSDCTLLKQRNAINDLTEFVLDFFQENMRIRYEVPGSDACAVDPANGLAPLQERRALASDPLVLTALDVFTGQVAEIRVGQRYRATAAPQAIPKSGDEPPIGPDEEERDPPVP
ncbi:MAG: DNA polymerase III subunit gamma/tau [Desulfobulbus sp.]|uniref:DNA polymerase III subunit gamma/tau n=1 Tax=Desulfobulbus sp. TaxID=895 RepID=UPI00285097C1|nr:DNA polymerase III subunit gamma/tau [Desulfobulbus sp.]MDR2551024.1 DNA polymerase III subunit gamma/tau [Desulfobulbus sp.]